MYEHNHNGENTTMLYSIDMTNNNGTGCLATSRTRQLDSTIRLNQDHVVVTIPHPTDTTMGNYSCQFHYLDITHNYELKSCDQLRQGHCYCGYCGYLNGISGDYKQDNYTYYEQCVYSTNGSA
ncbi:unnamed protein product, partial [Oppiella nova]